MIRRRWIFAFVFLGAVAASAGTYEVFCRGNNTVRSFLTGDPCPYGWVTSSGRYAVACRGNQFSQPIPFPHDKHVQRKLACVGCHTGAEKNVFAGIPPTGLCILCHRKDKKWPRTSPPMMKYLEAYRATGKEIPWQEVYRTPRHVYFSHRRHVTQAKLQCVICHGDVAQEEQSITKAYVPVLMASCLACHRKNKVSTDCFACHR